MRRVLPIIVSGVVALGSLFGVPAAALGASGSSLTVSPPTFQLNANPNDTLHDTISVTNNSAGAVTLQVSAQDFTVQDKEGSVTVKDDLGPNSIASWFSFAATQLSLAPKATALVPFSIHVPANASPGGHFATVLFNPVVAPNTSSTGASVIQRVGSLVLMQVSGNIIENGSISQFHAKTFKGGWTTVTGSDGKTQILVPVAEQLDQEHPRSFFDSGPIAFDVVFKNSGNTYFAPAGSVSIYDLFGHRVAQLALDPKNVFPSGERRVTVIWPSGHLWGGYYRADIAAVYGSQNKIITAETVFFAFPALLAVAILVILILIVLLRRRLRAAIAVLVKGR